MGNSYLLGWGSASDGQLGETDSDAPTPRPLAGLPSEPIVAITPGLWSSIIVTAECVYSTRPPGTSPRPPVSLPPPYAPIPSVISAATGRDFTLLLTASGSLHAIGTGAYGELGLGPQTHAATPTHITSLTNVKIIDIAAAEFHWLALDNTGAVFSCGNNASGQLGLAHSECVKYPTRVKALWPHPIVCIATGDGHSAALSSSGKLFCFGSNKHGQLGNSSFRVRVASLTPTVVPVPGPVELDRQVVDGDAKIQDHVDPETTCGGYRYADVACGSAHTVALRNDGSLICWGKGGNGQLGSRAARNLSEPTEIHTDVRFVSVSAGERHSAALTADGRLFMWGDGSCGQLGDGEMSDKYLPVALSAPQIPRVSTKLRFLKVACGGFHTLAITGGMDERISNAADVNRKKLARCVVDNMLQAKAGLSRFGNATVLLHTFVGEDSKYGDVDYIGAESAHLKFAHMFGQDGKMILRLAAARIRHQAQVAFGLVKEGENVAFGVDERSEQENLITAKAKFSKQESDFCTSVANSAESGRILFLAFMNPIYGERQCRGELSELAACVLRCEGDGRESLLNLIAHCEEGVLLNHVIRPLQGVLTNELNIYRRITRNAIFVTKMLALCYHGVWRGGRLKNSRGLGLCRKEFYNESVSEMVNFSEDYDRWVKGSIVREDGGVRMADVHEGDSESASLTAIDLTNLPPLPVAGTDEGTFSFCRYSFLLSEAAKFKILELESHRTMNNETMRSFLSFGALQMPALSVPGSSSRMIRVPANQIAHLQYLVLHVRRNHIVSDSFIQISEFAQHHPRELRKPLKVAFDGEEGVDEGGVSKEYYQVLLEAILSADYGMFESDEDGHFHWFCKDFLEPESSWTLIGVMFGLAAFNSILLDVQFPPVVYRKLAAVLRGKKCGSYITDLNDVIETFPEIGRSLQHLKDYDGDDVEDVFMLKFEISRSALFGKVEQVSLIPGGENISVTNDNRNYFIQVYSDYLINGSIGRAFNAFATGFAFMINGPFVQQLTWEELETLVVGEKELNFGINGLKKGVVYEGGFDESSLTVTHLWQVLDEFDDVLKRKFLSFATGTDRSPIGGLQRLKLVVQRAGPDTYRLPTSYTCFNCLMLPEYGTRAKLRDRLLTAIENSKGFGLQ